MQSNQQVLWDQQRKDRRYTLLVPQGKRLKDRPEIYFRSRERGNVALDYTLEQRITHTDTSGNSGCVKIKNSKEIGFSEQNTKAVNAIIDESDINLSDARAKMENKSKYDKLKIRSLHAESNAKLKISFWTFGLTKTQRLGVLRDLVKRTPTVDIERLPTDWRIALRQLVKRSKAKNSKKRELYKKAHTPLKQSREYHIKNIPEVAGTEKSRNVSIKTKATIDAKYQDGKWMKSEACTNTVNSSSSLTATSSHLKLPIHAQTTSGYPGESTRISDHVPLKIENFKSEKVVKEEENHVVTVTPMLKPSMPYSHIDNDNKQKALMVPTAEKKGLKPGENEDEDIKNDGPTSKSSSNDGPQLPDSISSKDGANLHIKSASHIDSPDITANALEKEKKPYDKNYKPATSHTAGSTSHSKHSNTSRAHKSRKDNSTKTSSSNSDNERNKSHKVRSSSSHSSSSHTKEKSHSQHRKDKKEHSRHSSSSSSSHGSRDSHGKHDRKHSSQRHSKERHHRERSRSRSRSSSSSRDKDHHNHDKHHRHSRNPSSGTHQRSHSSNDISKSTPSLKNSSSSNSSHSSLLTSSKKQPSDDNNASSFSQSKDLSKSNSATISSKSNKDSTPSSAIATAETSKIAQSQRSDSQTEAATKLKWEQSIKKRMKEQKSNNIPFKKVSPLLVQKKDISKIYDDFKEPLNLEKDSKLTSKCSTLKNRSFIDVFRIPLSDPRKKTVQDNLNSSHDVLLKTTFEKKDSETLSDNGKVVQETVEAISGEKALSGMKLPIVVPISKEGKKTTSANSSPIKGPNDESSDENKENSNSQTTLQPNDRKLGDGSDDTEISAMEAPSSSVVPAQQTIQKDRPSSQAGSEATEGMTYSYKF